MDVSKCISNRGEYSEHTFTHNPECDYCGELPASRFTAMRTALEAIQELHKAVAFYGEDADWWVCGHCHDNHPCATRRLADQGLGDKLARTTKNGDAS